MYHPFLNQQNYLADRVLISDAWQQEMCKIALFKIKTWHMASDRPSEQANEKEEVREIIQSSFFDFIPPGFVLSEEGYYFSEMKN